MSSVLSIHCLPGIVGHESVNTCLSTLWATGSPAFKVDNQIPEGGSRRGAQRSVEPGESALLWMMDDALSR